eukprot:4629924-Pyramimonas_sp.AAC.1
MDSHPTPTRFFTFAECVWTLRMMKVIGLPAALLHVHGLNPQAEQQKRIAAVVKYYQSDAATLELKRTSICLRLSMLAVSLTGQKARTATATKQEKLPLLVRLGQGEVVSRTDA